MQVNINKNHKKIYLIISLATANQRAVTRNYYIIPRWAEWKRAVFESGRSSLD